MKNYVSPTAMIVLCDKEEVVRTSNGYAVFGTDNGVYWPGKTVPKEESVWE